VLERVAQAVQRAEHLLPAGWWWWW
jgi:hypothetical protein